MSFRDGGPAFERARAIELELAHRLVRAPELPVDIPKFGMRLHAVYVDSAGVGLSVGRDDVLAKLYFRQPMLTKDRAPGSVEVWPENDRTPELADRTLLEQMRGRLRAASTRVDWPAVWELADELRKSPTRVPLAFFRQIVDGVSPPQGLVRTGFRCNQDCGMCWQGRDWPEFGAEQVITWIEDLAAQGVEKLIVSGGEPTLDRQLLRYLERATSLGMRVTLETNAIQMAKKGFVERLQSAAPGFKVFVSLHSADPEVSDRVTRAPGTHERTVRGILALLDHGVRVTLNAVIVAQTIDQLHELPDFVHTHFSAKPSFEGLMISLPQTPFDQSLDRELRAHPDRVRSALTKTIDRAHALGVRLDGLSGPCGPPLCAFGADPRVTDRAPRPEPVDFRMYLRACEECAVRDACFGVHRSDVEVWGDACAAAIPQRIASSPRAP